MKKSTINMLLVAAANLTLAVLYTLVISATSTTLGGITNTLIAGGIHVTLSVVAGVVLRLKGKNDIGMGLLASALFMLSLPFLMILWFKLQ